MNSGRRINELAPGAVYAGENSILRPASAVSAVSSNMVGNPSNSAYGVSSLTDLNQSILKANSIATANSERSALEASNLRAWQQEQMRSQNAFNAAEAAKNRSWQEYMSNSAHQREVADLRAAGLNPILSASGGNGAAVTSGATASGSVPAGAKGDVDTSANTAITNLLGNFLSAQTQLEAQRLSAASNQAIADKNNSAAQLIAAIYGEYGLKQADISGQYGLQSARTHAGASMYGAEQAAAAHMYSSDRQAQSARDVQSSKEAHDKYIHKTFPNNEVAAIAAIIENLFGGSSSPAASAGVKDWKGKSLQERFSQRAEEFQNMDWLKLLFGAK